MVGIDEGGRTRRGRCRQARCPGAGRGERIPGLVDEESTLPRATVRDDATATNRDDAVGARTFGGVVGDVDDGDAARGQGGEEVEHFGAPRTVNHRDGFVGDEQARGASERAREREALELPAGQGARVSIREAGEADLLEQLLEVEVIDLLSAHAPGDIFGNTLSENKEFGALPHERGTADGPEDAAALPHPRAGFGAREEEGQGGLARAVMPDDDGELGALEAQRDAAQGGVVGTRVGEVDVGEGQGQGGRGLGAIMRVRRAGSCIQERVPARVEGDATEDRAEEPPAARTRKDTPMKRVMGIQIHHQSTNHWPSRWPASTKPPEWGMCTTSLRKPSRVLRILSRPRVRRSDRIQNAMPVPTPQTTPRPAATPQTGSQEARFL